MVVKVVKWLRPALIGERTGTHALALFNKDDNSVYYSEESDNPAELIQRAKNDCASGTFIRPGVHMLQ